MTDQRRDRIAAALSREDVNWGYHCAFSADPATCDMTTAYTDAVLAVVQPELDRLQAEVTATQNRTYTEGASGMREYAEALPDGDPRIPGLLDAAHVLLAARTFQES
ncbi:hypothetical protein KCMC57_64900 (plasmid) [Kitasatospora sp. CMC57]|uniref:Uncharacterized protein n=1 Tax=Kitasatospora sp. CMC57 TaxID=3231513 RepID=A0AB33KCA4_9ACTN